jgi:hypothetical protein
MVYATDCNKSIISSELFR